MLNGLFGWKRKIDNGQRYSMESVLESVLHPMTPRSQFVDSLRKGLMDYEIMEEKGSRAINYQNTILIFAGFFSAALLLSIGIRILMTLIGAIGIIHYQRRKMSFNRIGNGIKSTS
jgi:hypothetical protein